MSFREGLPIISFPENAIPGNPSAIGMRQNEAEFQKACSEAERSLQKLSKGIEILVGSSEGFDECMYSHYVDGNMDGWEHDFEVYSGHQEFLAGKDEAVTGICSRFARNSKKAVLYVNAVGTENSGKNIYALDGGSRLFDNTGKEVFRMPQFAEAGMMFEISKGKVKALPCGGKTAPKSFKPGEPIAQIHDALVYMIRENLKRFHIERMVIGASGGIDSAVSAVLYAEAIGAKNVVLTGVSFSPDELGSAVSDGSSVKYDFNPKLDKMSHGTGDVYASVFAGAVLRGKSALDAAALAADVVCEAIKATEDDHWYGVSFERAIPFLVREIG